MLKFIDYRTFIRLVVLTAFSSSIVLLIDPRLLTVGGILSLISLAVLVSFFICLFSHILEGSPKIRKYFEIACYSVIALITFIDVFLYVNFGIVIDETVFSILEGTNIDECKDFIQTYANWKTFLAIALLSAFYALTFYLTSFINKTQTTYIGAVVLILLICSVAKLSSSVYTTVRYGFGGHLAAYSTYSRIARSCVVYTNITKETDRLIDNLQKWQAEDLKQTTVECDKMAVIIGESYSRYHSQLYGYDKDTSPLLMEKVQSGDLIVYTDVITPINDTERAFRAIYSLGEYYSDVYSDCLLFPYVFKQAGYYTVNIDNMDLASSTNRVKDSEKLSELMFDFRNSEVGEYDEEILEWLDVDDCEHPKQLFVIKLLGQHYDYADQFPDSWARYDAKDYDRADLPENKVQLIADYDNATIYNDFVVNSIIDHFKDDKAVVLYFSDHGEEVYDERDYMGHGGTTPFLNYQFDIPFMIWMSDSYKESNVMQVQKLVAHKDCSYTIDDVSHTILDMAGISCSQLVPERSLANEAFEPRAERVILRSLVYY